MGKVVHLIHHGHGRDYDGIGTDSTITMTMSVAADMTMSMSIITTMTMSAVVDIITIIMQTKYSPAGDVRPLRSSQERDWRRCWRAFPLLKSMA